MRQDRRAWSAKTGRQTVRTRPILDRKDVARHLVWMTLLSGSNIWPLVVDNETHCEIVYVEYDTISQI